MDKVKEAFDAHSAQLEGLLACLENVCSNHEGSIKRAAREIALAVHFEACGRHVNFGAKDETLSSPGYTRCGDGWDCPRAKALKELEA